MSRVFAARFPGLDAPITPPFSVSLYVPRDIYIASRAVVPNGYAGIPPCLKPIAEYSDEARAFFKKIESEKAETWDAEVYGEFPHRKAEKTTDAC